MLSGLVSGAVAAPAFVIGASAGALVAARAIGSPRIAATLSEVLGTQVSSEEAWQLFLLSIVVAAVFQAVVLILASTAAAPGRRRSKVSTLPSGSTPARGLSARPLRGLVS